MQSFNDLISVIEKLLSPSGCEWVRKQTLSALRIYLIEEIYEVVEAIDLNDNEKIAEEVGDVFFNLIFICKLAEREHRFDLATALQLIHEKLIRRHPHVFGTTKVSSVEEVLEQWEAIKKLEKGRETRKSLLDDIPKGLPSLARAQRLAGKFEKKNYCLIDEKFVDLPTFENEDQLGSLLFTLVQQAEKQGLNAKHALLKKLTEIETQFRSWETESTEN